VDGVCLAKKLIADCLRSILGGIMVELVACAAPTVLWRARVTGSQPLRAGLNCVAPPALGVVGW
jgi:hypothetical protein